MSERKVINASVLCSNPLCAKEVKVVLIELKSGVFLIHEYLCGDCLGLMTLEISDADYEQNRNDETVG